MMSPIAVSDAAADEDAFRAALLQVLELNPQFALAYVQLARLALRQNDLERAFGLSRKAEELDPSLAGYHIQSGEILLRMGKGAEAASFAKFVAQRWTRTDHDEAVELWNAIPFEQRPPGETLSMSVWEGMQSLGGSVKSVACSGPDGDITLVLNDRGRTLIFRGQHTFWGFSDTIWYGFDHFNQCHHLEGMRAVVHFRPALDASYAGELVDVDIRNDLPAAAAKDRAQATP
jgi:tetratricopeptide (TPR) repeat protein